MHIDLQDLDERLREYVKNSPVKTNKSVVIRLALKDFLDRKR